MNQPKKPQRASDDEREQAVDTLRQQWTVGRLSLAEFEHRAASAYFATTRAELADLLVDLPQTAWVPGRQPMQDRGHRSGVGRPGTRRFMQQHEFGAELDELFARALSHLVPELVADGYHVIEQEEPSRLVLQRESRCLLGVQFRPASRIGLRFAESARGTRLTIDGAARRAVRKAFARLSD